MNIELVLYYVQSIICSRIFLSNSKRKSFVYNLLHLVLLLAL